MINYSDEQLNFTNWFWSQDSKFLKLTGHAGSGKTTTMKLLQSSLPSKNTIWAAPSHQAKNILSGSIGKHIKVVTVASLLGLRPKVVNGRWTFEPAIGKHLIKDDIKYINIDESSMLSTSDLNYLLYLAEASFSLKKILFIGDSAQLPPVKEKISPVYQDQYSYIPEYRLSKIFRQSNNSIIQLANDTRTKGINTSKENGIVSVNISDRESIESFYLRFHNRDDTEEGMILCPTHDIKEHCNKIARNIFGLPVDRHFCNNEVIFLESPIGDSIPNGSRVRITSEPSIENFMGFKVWSCEVDNEHNVNIAYDVHVRKQIEKHLSKLANSFSLSVDDIEKMYIEREVAMINNKIIFASSGYAMTIHKSQGSTFENVMLILRDIEPFRNQGIHLKMIYTGITRAAKTLILGV